MLHETGEILCVDGISASLVGRAGGKQDRTARGITPPELSAPNALRRRMVGCSPAGIRRCFRCCAPLPVAGALHRLRPYPGLPGLAPEERCVNKRAQDAYGRRVCLPPRCRETPARTRTSHALTGSDPLCSPAGICRRIPTHVFVAATAPIRRGHFPIPDFQSGFRLRAPATMDRRTFNQCVCIPPRWRTTGPGLSPGHA